MRKLKNKHFTDPVVLPNTEYVRKRLAKIGYREGSGNSPSHKNLVTSSESYFTVNCGNKDIFNFDFPVWKGTVDFRSNIEMGLEIAARSTNDIIYDDEDTKADDFYNYG